MSYQVLKDILQPLSPAGHLARQLVVMNSYQPCSLAPDTVWPGPGGCAKASSPLPMLPSFTISSQAPGHRTLPALPAAALLLRRSPARPPPAETHSLQAHLSSYVVPTQHTLGLGTVCAVLFVAALNWNGRIRTHFVIKAPALLRIGCLNLWTSSMGNGTCPFVTKKVPSDTEANLSLPQGGAAHPGVSDVSFPV